MRAGAGGNPISGLIEQLRVRLMQKIFCVVVLFAVLAFSVRGQSIQGLPKLTDAAQISLITYSPGPELYQAFGHSCIRIRDDSYGMDRMYNFGVFDFETPNFYLKFARGDLLYQLTVTAGEEEIQSVVASYGQGVREVVLNLNLPQKQQLFEALEVNLLPENRYYRYDFVLDNCSTRVRDAFERTIGGPVSEPDIGKRTFRQMLDPYFERTPWIQFGVYLLLGSKVDRAVTPREACFLPADLERAVQMSKNGGQNLGPERKELYPADPLPQPWLFPVPIIVTGCVLWLCLWLVRGLKHARWVTALFLLLVGGTGLLLAGMAVWSLHWETWANYNLLWLLPTHFVAGIWLLLERKQPLFLRWYLWLGALAACAFLCFSFLLPQKFHPAIYPLIAILAWRCALEAKAVRRLASDQLQTHS
jgi:uncharacterized protein DUF4105